MLIEANLIGDGEGGAQPFIWQLFQNMCEILKKTRTEGMGSASLSNGSCTLHGTGTGTANHCSLLYCAPPSPRPCPGV